MGSRGARTQGLARRLYRSFSERRDRGYAAADDTLFFAGGNVSEPNPELPEPSGPGAPQPGYGTPPYGAPQPGMPPYGTPPYGAPWPGTPEPGNMPPQYGYQVPPSAYQPPPYGSLMYRDPLVSAPDEGYSGWASRVFGMVRRSWRSIVLISLILQVVPIVFLGLYAGTSGSFFSTGADGALHFDSAGLPAFLAILAVGGLVAAYLQAAGDAAIVWSVTRQAVGAPTALGEALGYGFRNGLRLFGWTLLYGLLVGVGIIACVVPGIYFAIAGCLYAPIALYDRGHNAIGGSFSLVNRSFWASFGRMVTVAGIVYGANLVLNIPVTVVTQVSPGVGQVLSVVLSVLIAPVSSLTLLGSVALFAELRTRIYPINSANLAAAL